jgi:hypothetical protein
LAHELPDAPEITTRLTGSKIAVWLILEPSPAASTPNSSQARPGSRISANRRTRRLGSSSSTRHQSRASPTRKRTASRRPRRNPTYQQTEETPQAPKPRGVIRASCSPVARNRRELFGWRHPHRHRRRAVPLTEPRLLKSTKIAESGTSGKCRVIRSPDVIGVLP